MVEHGFDVPDESVIPKLGMTEDEVNFPQHYRQGDIECIDAIRAMLGYEGFVAHLRGCIMKYNWRMLHKGKAIRDAQKLKWYTERLEREMAHGGERLN